jgi:hypothetical protein
VDLPRRKQQALMIAMAVLRAQRWCSGTDTGAGIGAHWQGLSVGRTLVANLRVHFPAQPAQESTMGLSACPLRMVSSNNSPSAYAALALGGTLCADDGIGHSRR